MSAKKKAEREGGKASPSTPTGRTLTAKPLEKWTAGKQYSSKYYYDEQLGENGELPPDGLDLSDFWVVQVVKSSLKPTERRDKYPTIFTSKYLRSDYRNKGRPSVHKDSNGKWRYDIIFDTFQMHGEEGYETQIFDLGIKPSTRRDIGDGDLCLNVQKQSTVKATNPDVRTRASEKRKREEVGSGGEDRKRKSSSSVRKSSSSVKIQKCTDPTGESGDTPIKVGEEEAPGFYIPTLAQSEERRNDSDNDELTQLRVQNEALKSQNEELQAQNAEVQENYEQSERGLVLVVGALSVVHEIINSLSRRTGIAAELLKNAVRIMTVTRECTEDELSTMTDFFNDNATRVTEIVQNGLVAVRKVHSEFPELSRLIFYHDEETKQRLTKWMKDNGGQQNDAEGQDDANDGKGDRREEHDSGKEEDAADTAATGGGNDTAASGSE